MKNQLWVEKYRPKTVSEYVFVDDRLKEQVDGWLKEGIFPHLRGQNAAQSGQCWLSVRIGTRCRPR